VANSRQLRYLAKGVCIVLAAYVLAAYVVVPALWSHYEHQPGLTAHPMVTQTAQGIPGDPLNVGLVGSREEVVRALWAAGWHPADPITLRSSLDIGLSVILSRPYPDAPVSSLFYLGRRQDLAFEKPTGRSPASRHHVRLWLGLAHGAEGREVWLGAASFDRAVGFSHDTGQITHHIDADLDAERAFFIGSLAREGVLDRSYLVPGIGLTLNGRNGEGDRYFTDGDVVIGVIDPRVGAAEPAPRAVAPPPVTAKTRLLRSLVAIGRFLHLLPAQPHEAH
jgi:hypothetical protein